MSSFSLSSRFCIASLLLLLATTTASADYMPVLWQYSTTVGPADGSSTGMNYSVAVTPPAVSWLPSSSFYDNYSAYSSWQNAYSALRQEPGLRPSLSYNAMAGSSRIAMSGFSRIDLGQDVGFNPVPQFSQVGSQAQGLSYTITLTDLASGQSGTLTMSWKLQPYPVYSEVEQTGGWLTKLIPASPAVQSIKLGNNLYNVTYDGTYGGLTVDVGVNPTPEPSTLILAIVGLTGTGLAAWRKKRQRARNAAHPQAQPLLY